MFIFQKFEIFSDSHSVAISRKLLIKSQNRNIFNYLNRILITDKFSFQQYIIHKTKNSTLRPTFNLFHENLQNDNIGIPADIQFFLAWHVNVSRTASFVLHIM